MTDAISKHPSVGVPNQAEPGQEQLLADFATKADLAAAFKVSSRTIERWVRMRVLPQPVRLGRTLLFHMPTVRDHLLRGAAGGSTCRLRRR